MNVEEDDSDNEPKQPERVSLADLKHRGKKKAIAPVNRTGHAIRSKHIKLIILLLQLIMNCHIFIFRLILISNGFCKQVFLEACCHTVPLSLAMLQIAD